MRPSCQFGHCQRADSHFQGKLLSVKLLKINDNRGVDDAPLRAR